MLASVYNLSSLCLRRVLGQPEKLCCALVARPSHYIPWSGDGHLLNITTLTGEFYVADACVQVATPAWSNVCALVCRCALHAHTPGKISLFAMTDFV